MNFVLNLNIRLQPGKFMISTRCTYGLGWAAAQGPQDSRLGAPDKSKINKDYKNRGDLHIFRFNGDPLNSFETV